MYAWILQILYFILINKYFPWKKYYCKYLSILLKYKKEFPRNNIKNSSGIVKSTRNEFSNYSKEFFENILKCILQEFISNITKNSFLLTFAIRFASFLGSSSGILREYRKYSQRILRGLFHSQSILKEFSMRIL